MILILSDHPTMSSSVARIHARGDVLRLNNNTQGDTNQSVSPSERGKRGDYRLTMA